MALSFRNVQTEFVYTICVDKDMYTVSVPFQECQLSLSSISNELRFSHRTMGWYIFLLDIILKRVYSRKIFQLSLFFA